ncbi:hypothetical protein C3K47_02475 [Solitalea longa]|uniref:Uncharacterized protein n=1 Tax=Solitalea longa TaxID=2079460 RepID=A0A2S5A9V8_9SPHI|nr:DUF5958 family protein [Solitalea longa]POY39381.1 hypothetical protein C3K47_02475 [Solitalea longa]
MNHSEILLNSYSQDKISKTELLTWFTALPEIEKKDVLTSLSWFIENVHPTNDEIHLGINSSGLKNTYTAAILLANNTFNIAFRKILDLPASENQKSFEFLISIFKIADHRRRTFECKGYCNHEWHCI